MSRASGNPRTLALLGRALAAKGDAAQGRELCARALARAPTDAEICGIVAEVMSCGVPDWHFPMVQDTARNTAYDAALRDAIHGGERVLEIGTGSGLLAMMAVRAGAAEVVTCEEKGAIAEVAREIVARNGLADRVRILAKHSSDLDPKADLRGAADVLVCEIFSNDLVGEGALPAIEQAARRLLRSGARIIPASGTIRIALAEDMQSGRNRIAMVEGFDLSPFNRLSPHRYRIGVGSQRLALRSEPADLFAFDFQSGGPFPEARATATLLAQGGWVNGIAQWIRLQMGESIHYEDRPRPGANSAWAVLFYPLMQAIDLAPGAALTVHGAHDRHSLRVWADIPPEP